MLILLLTVTLGLYAWRSDMPSLIAFGSGHNLPCCRRSNARKTTTRACRHLANGRESENGQTDRQTDGRTNRNILYALPPYRCRGHNKPIWPCLGVSLAEPFYRSLISDLANLLRSLDRCGFFEMLIAQTSCYMQSFHPGGIIVHRDSIIANRTVELRHLVGVGRCKLNRRQSARV